MNFVAFEIGLIYLEDFCVTMAMDMSDLGNKWLDEQIKTFIMGKSCFQSNLSHTCISEFNVT